MQKGPSDQVRIMPTKSTTKSTNTAKFESTDPGKKRQLTASSDL